MIIFKRLILMLQFFTTIPLPINLDVNEEDFGKGLVFSPLVGLLLGGILTGIYILISPFFPNTIMAALLLVFYILLTGGLHLDGVGDTFDGIFSHRSRERMLEIMRDSRVGTNAVLALICVLFLNWVFLSSADSSFYMQILLLMPVAGRIGSLIGAGVSRYARSGEGLGKSFIEYCGLKEVGIGLVLYFVIFYTVAQGKGLFLGIISVLSSYLLVKYLGRKIGGATGDILGAVCELNQTVFLMMAYFVFR